jgi:hypothetical protein
MPATSVSSTDALAHFHVVASEYLIRARNAAAALAAERQAATRWLQDEQLPFWRAELRRCQCKVADAEAALFGARLAERDPRLHLLRREAERAHAAAADAEKRLRATRRWLSRVERDTAEFGGHVSRLVSFLDSDFPRGLARLDRQIAHLNAYISTAPPESPSGTADAT